MLCFTFLQAQPKQKGKASYYSKKLTGARTSSGERLHHDSMTCAHRTYPFGTRLKVTNTSNGKIVFVKVTDRGPYRRGRIIDLSWGAAKALGILSQGVAMVMVEPVDTTIVPFRPNSNFDMPEFDFEGFEWFDGIRPEWEEMKEINHKTPTAIPKKSTNDNSVKPTGTKATPAGTKTPASGAGTQKTAPKQAATTTKASSPESGNGKAKSQSSDNAIEEINSRPNTSRVYSKRQGGR